MAVHEAAAMVPDTGAGWRYKAGIVLFAMMILVWLLVPIEIAVGLPASIVAASAAAITIGNKAILLLAIAVMGKAGFKQLKAKLFHQLTPPADVGPARYRIGLVMFFMPFVHNLLETWASHVTPHLVINRMWVDILMNGMLIASLFVLGGNFWDKLRALFVVDASAVFPADANTAARPAG